MDTNGIMGPNKCRYNQIGANNNFTFGQLSCELGPIMTRYDFLWAR